MAMNDRPRGSRYWLKALAWLLAIVPIALFAADARRERLKLTRELETIASFRVAMQQAHATQRRTYRQQSEQQEQTIQWYRLRLLQP
jgi:hypothetical protein